MVKNPPAMRETWVWSLGWEDALKEGMATLSSILAWRTNPMDRGACQAIVHGVAKSQTWLSDQVQHSGGGKYPRLPSLSIQNPTLKVLDIHSKIQMTRNNVKLILCSSTAKSHKPRNKAITSRFQTPTMGESCCGQCNFPAHCSLAKSIWWGGVSYLVFTYIKKHTIPLQNGLCLKHTLLGLKPNAYLFPVLVLNRKKHSHRCRLGTTLCGYLIFIYYMFHKIVPIISTRNYFRY